LYFVIEDNHEEPTQFKEKYIEKAVDALISGKKTEVNFTKAIGCGIKVAEN